MVFEEIKILPQSIGAYRHLDKAGVKRAILAATHLKGKRVFHINSTEKGGGVAEMLKGQVALERSLKIDSRWLVIRPKEEFFQITKKIHNLLQGKAGFLSGKEQRAYLVESYRIAKSIVPFLKKNSPDLIVIHDPQPLVVGCEIPSEVPRIFRLHIDTSTPSANTIEFLRPFLERYNALIVSGDEYSPSWFSKKKIHVIMPSIDPFSEKNRRISVEEAREILMQFNIHPDRPIIAQVSRFDPWKDPMGVIDAYYRAKNKIPDLQLLLVGIFQAYDDPEALQYFETVKRHAKGDPDIHLFSDPRRFVEIGNDMFVNAVQRASDVILQKSTREGFGLTVTEAMWKGKAVIGGDASGIRFQIKNGKDGFIVSDAKKASRLIIKLIKNPGLAAKIGKAAQKKVVKKFLRPRYIKENLDAYNAVLKQNKK